MKIRMLFAGLAITIAAPGVMAQVVHQDWEAHGSRGDCCAVTLPLLSDGAVNRAGQAYVSVTHNRSEGLRDAVSFVRSEEHTSELQSLMSISYAVFCFKKNIHTTIINNHANTCN